MTAYVFFFSSDMWKQLNYFLLSHTDFFLIFKDLCNGERKFTKTHSLHPSPSPSRTKVKLVAFFYPDIQILVNTQTTLRSYRIYL